jgi:hypothetical protein
MSYQKVNYTCILCGFDFKNNISHLRKHFMRKNKCNCINFYFDYDFLLELLDNNTYNEYCNNLIKKKKVQCQFCFKFSHSNNLKRHLKTCKKNPNNYNNTTNNNTNNNYNNYNITNNFNINNNIIINPFGNETYDIDYLTNLLDIEPDYSNFFGNKFNFNQRIDNIQKNYNYILKHIYNQPSNINFKMVPNNTNIDKMSSNNIISDKKRSNKIISNNNNNNIIKILIKDDNIEFKEFNHFVNDVFNNIHNIFLNIVHNYEKNNNIKIQHYYEFIDKLIERKNNFISKYNDAETELEKNNIKNSLFIYYEGFNKLFKNISDNIIFKFYEISHNNSF